jgi:hypothetical protein
MRGKPKGMKTSKVEAIILGAEATYHMMNLAVENLVFLNTRTNAMNLLINAGDANVGAEY